MTRQSMPIRSEKLSILPWCFSNKWEVIARDFNPVSMDDVALFVMGKKRLPPKPVAVTFDDGYADNLEVAAPVLNRFGIPGIVYATVGSVDKKLAPGISRLRYSFFTTKKNSWSAQDQRWELKDRLGRVEPLKAAAERCACIAGDPQDDFVSAIEHQLEVEPVKQNLMLTWDQARELIRQGHTIGSHGMSHPEFGTH